MKKLSVKKFIITLMIYTTALQLLAQIYNEYFIKKKDIDTSDQQKSIFYQWFFERNHIKCVYIIEYMAVDIILIRNLPKIWNYISEGTSFYLATFLLRFFFTKNVFKWYITRIVNKRYPEYTLSPNFQNSDYPPNKPISYLGYYFAFYVIEMIVMTATHLINGNKAYLNEEEEEDFDESEILEKDMQNIPIDAETGETTIKKKQKCVCDDSDDSYSTNNEIKDSNDRCASYFWLINFLIISTIIIIMSYIVPNLIDNQSKGYEKITDKKLLKTIRKISKTAKLKVNTLYLMTESETANAFVVGLTTKKVIVTKKLQDMVSSEELAAIIGHELGHWYYNDMAIVILGKVMPFLFLSLFIQYISHKDMNEFGFTNEIPDKSVYILISLIVYDYIYEAWRPVECLMGRVCERHADCFSSSFNLPIVTALEKLLNNPYEEYTTRLYNLFYESHPKRDERIANLCRCPKVVWPKVIYNL